MTPTNSPAPTELEDALSPQWPSGVLSAASQAGEVTAVSVIEILKMTIVMDVVVTDLESFKLVGA